MSPDMAQDSEKTRKYLLRKWCRCDFTLKQKRLGDLRKEMMAQVVGEVESVEGSCLENQHQSVVKVCQMKTKAADAGVNSTK